MSDVDPDKAEQVQLVRTLEAALAIPDAPTTKELKVVRDAYRALPGNGAGGTLHIVLEDGNTEDRCVDWCVRVSSTQHNDLAGYLLGKLLLRVPESQRDKVWGSQ